MELLLSNLVRNRGEIEALAKVAKGQRRVSTNHNVYKLSISV